MKKCYLGLDVGSNGGMAIIHEGYVDLFSFHDYDMGDICEELKIVNEQHECYAVVEDVHSVHGSSAKANFTFGYNKGWIVGMLTAMRIPYSMIPPKEWQGGVWERCDKVMEGRKVKTKETSINCAKRIFPNVDLLRTPRCTKADDGICDALLMAEYARRKNL